jgi:hypothetical protein
MAVIYGNLQAHMEDASGDPHFEATALIEINSCLIGT